MNGKLYFLNFFSNLHVGGTGNDFSIVDLQVQRDPVTERPVIFASSLKGALRSHAANIKDFPVDQIFGQDIDKDGNTKQGNVAFTDVHLLLYPLRTNQSAYMLAACPAMLQEFVDQLALLEIEDCPLVQTCEKLINEARGKWKRIESVNKPALLFGKNVTGTLRVESKLAEHVKEEDLSALPTAPAQLLMLTDTDMKMILESLPVLAHNRLKNGVSSALWYEEVVPRRSIFYTMTFSNIKEEDDKLPEMLTNGFIQIGANATLGYGLCKFSAYTE